MGSLSGWSWRRSLLIGLIAAAFAVLAESAGAAGLTLTLEAQAVVVEGLTPRGGAALIGVTRHVDEDDFPIVRLYERVLGDEDGDGRVRLEIEQPLLLRSLFLAVDLTSGETQAVTSLPSGLRLVPWRGAGVRPDAIGKLADQRVLALVLLVRPGVGAWSLRTADGAPDDEDGEVNSRLEVAADRFRPLGGAPLAPIAFLPNDIVALIDPSSLELSAERVGPGAGQ